ncbi:MAG: long-chain-fatty-acid--CoA ligase [Desulfatiglandales bacterium]
MNIATLLENSSIKRSAHIAIRFEDRELDYKTLNELVGRFAMGLKKLGFGQGDRCVLMLQNCPEFVIAYYAIARLRGIVIPVNFLFKVHELKHIFDDSKPKAFIGMHPFLDEAISVLRELPHVKLKVALNLKNQEGFIDYSSVFDSEPAKIEEASDDETFAILYTSGTTGVPKGAQLTHGSLSSNAITVAEMRQTDPEDIVLGVLPLYHVYGQTSAMNSSIYLGLTIHLFRQFDPDQVLGAVEAYRSTILIAVPTMFNRLLIKVEGRGLKRSSIRYCVSGGASLPVEILQRFQERFQTVIYEGYGLTESSPVCIENPFGKKTKPGSIGLPIPGFEAKIVDESGKEVKSGEIGELIVKGPGVMKGYLNREKETKETIVDGWLHTGDMAYKDQDGYIFIVDRKKDMIIRGGYNVYPREIEEILFSHPSVLEAAVYGVPHPDLGEEVAADVILKQKITHQELIEYVKAKVAPYKYPRIINIVEELPKSHTGKVLKKDLRERFIRQKEA